MGVFENVLKQMDKAFSHLEIRDDVKEILKSPERVLEVSIPVKMDDGSVKVFKGFRV